MPSGPGPPPHVAHAGPARTPGVTASSVQGPRPTPTVSTAANESPQPYVSITAPGLAHGVRHIDDAAPGGRSTACVGYPLDVADYRDPDGLRQRDQRGVSSSGAPNARSDAGMATLPSGRWWFSSRAMRVRPTATAVPLSVCTGSVSLPLFMRHLRRRAW